MPTFDERLQEVAAQLSCEPEQVLAVLDRATSELQHRRYYFYYISSSSSSRDDEQSSPGPPRTIPVFTSPDEALAYAQYNRSGEVPRVRGADKRWLLLTLLKNERLGAIIFMDRSVGPGPLHSQPGAVRVTRRRLVEALTVPAEI